MPRLTLRADDGWTAHDERVNLSDFESETFRAQLAERLAWAVADAEERCRGRGGPERFARERDALLASRR